MTNKKFLICECEGYFFVCCSSFFFWVGVSASRMDTIVGSVAGTLLGNFLPFDNATNMALAMAGKDVVTIGLGKCGGVWGWVKTKILGRNRRYVVISASEMGRLSPIYKKLEEFIISHQVPKLGLCNLVPVRGEIAISLRDAYFMRPLEIIHNTHKLYMFFDDEYDTVKETTKDNPQGVKRLAKPIYVYSDTATMDEIREYITGLVKLERKPSNVMVVYRAVRSSKEKTPEWDCLRFQTNKTIFNTVLSRSATAALFDDVELFMGSEALYAQRGLDYKRGYMLYGPPGCGKSSSIKAVASKYGLPVFYLDMDTVKNNSELISLMNDILYEVPDSPYVLTIEDFDRHECFTNKANHAQRKEKVTLQCLLNVIDGIVEAHGRILFITCNDRTEIDKTDALIRPGRIDRMIEFSECDSDQASRLINNFFQTTEVVNAQRMRTDVTPADLIKSMQTTQSIAATLEYLYSPTGTTSKSGPTGTTSKSTPTGTTSKSTSNVKLSNSDLEQQEDEVVQPKKRSYPTRNSTTQRSRKRIAIE